MTDAFFDHPILNSPYEHPSRHWELDHGQPTQRIIENRRLAEYITPLPKPKKRKGQAEQSSLLIQRETFEIIPNSIFAITRNFIITP